MTPNGRIKLASELLDLPLVDGDGCYCGTVDDIEFAGDAESLAIKALLIGPGAYEGRMPRLLYWLVRKVAGNRITRVPIAKVQTIGSAVKLDCLGSELGLERGENAVAKWMPRWGAL